MRHRAHILFYFFSLTRENVLIEEKNKASVNNNLFWKIYAHFFLLLLNVQNQFFFIQFNKVFPILSLTPHTHTNTCSISIWRCVRTEASQNKKKKKLTTTAVNFSLLNSNESASESMIVWLVWNQVQLTSFFPVYLLDLNLLVTALAWMCCGFFSN